jgi:hypothetical protein
VVSPTNGRFRTRVQASCRSQPVAEASSNSHYGQSSGKTDEFRPGCKVALGWLWGRNRLAISRLWGGLGVAFCLRPWPGLLVPTAASRRYPSDTPVHLPCTSGKSLTLRHLQRMRFRKSVRLRHFAPCDCCFTPIFFRIDCAFLAEGILQSGQRTRLAQARTAPPFRPCSDAVSFWLSRILDPFQQDLCLVGPSGICNSPSLCKLHDCPGVRECGGSTLGSGAKARGNCNGLPARGARLSE